MSLLMNTKALKAGKHDGVNTVVSISHRFGFTISVLQRVTMEEGTIKKTKVLTRIRMVPEALASWENLGESL